jgi:hypothetical protein
MDTLDYTDRDITSDEFYRLIDDTRKANKGKWYAFGGYVDGKKVVVKAYNTRLQLYLVDGVRYAGPMDISIKEYRKELTKPFNK